MRIVAHDMEHPEHRSGPTQILRNVPVTASHHVDEALEVGRVAHVFRREGAALDEIEDENPRLCVQHARAQTRQMRRAASRQLVRAYDSVHEDIVADPHDVAASAILDHEVLVGDAAGQRDGIDTSQPDRQRGDARR